MAENFEYQNTVDSLSERTDDLAKEIRNLEDSLWNENEKISWFSSEIREMFYKIQSLDRQDDIDESTIESYHKVLDCLEKSLLEWVDCKLEFWEIQAELMEDMGQLEDKNWNKLSDILMDWSYIEWLKSLYSWIKNFWKEMISRLEDTLKSMLSPEERVKTISGLYDAIRNPIDFFTSIIDFIKEDFSYLKDEHNAIKENSTESWYWVEMWQFLPERLGPELAENIWPGNIAKFLRFLKLDVPDTAAWFMGGSKSNNKENTRSNSNKEDSNNVDILDQEYWFSDLETQVSVAETNIWKLWEAMSVEHILENPERLTKLSNTMHEINYYIVNNAKNIIDFWKVSNYIEELNLLRKATLRVVESWKLSPSQTKIMESARESILDSYKHIDSRYLWS